MTRSRLLTAALVLGGFLAADPGEAGASCAARTPRQQFDGADTVFVGRAGKIRIEGKRSLQPITVLHTLKGRPGKIFTRVRVAGVQIPNDRKIKAGEVALFLSFKGEIDLCAGNHPLAAQMPRLKAYFALSKHRIRNPPLAAFAGVIAALLRPYLHDRAVVHISHAPLRGKRLRQGKTSLPFIKGRRKSAILITRAASSGPMHAITGFYPVEGFEFQALLMTVRGKMTVVYKSGWER